MTATNADTWWDEPVQVIPAISMFIADRCVVGPGLKMDSGTAYEEFRQWHAAEICDNFKTSHKCFTMFLKGCFKRGRLGKRLYFKGIGLLSRINERPENVINFSDYRRGLQ